MKECPRDCLSCANSFSIPDEKSISGADALFCTIKQEIVEEDDYCEEYN